MVSTRGVKLKFSEGEKVLCYEPDPAKTKVLYNSKVLSITVGKDESGKRLVEFLIHFQGWNSTWDRFVTEEYVLKDTEENRQLQRELAEKAQLTAGGNLYKRERKKRRRKLSERISESLEAKRVCDSPSTEPEPAPDLGELSDQSTSGADDDVVPIHLSDAIKRHLELDYRLVTQENKLSKLPCTPNVVTILENFFRHWAMKQLNLSDKGNHSNNSDKTKDFDSIFRNLNLCKEVADGLRIYFDFTLGSLLLYRQEKDQFRQAVSQPASTYYPGGLPGSIKQEVTDSDCEDKFNHEGEDIARKKSLRSSHKVVTGHEHTNGKPHPAHLTSLSTCSGASTSSMLSGTQCPRLSALISQIQEWRIVPPSAYSIQPAPPSLIYGAIHLARLFVKLPELLQTTNMSDDKLEIVLEHFGYFLKYLEDHSEWFGVSYYKENPDSLSDADH
uniref:Protein male-specific lethal-3 n=1 Tax=Cuerna arida TaxID=1464854 RepID=A0A1B6FRP4_9HEMI